MGDILREPSPILSDWFQHIPLTQLYNPFRKGNPRLDKEENFEEIRIVFNKDKIKQKLIVIIGNL